MQMEVTAVRHLLIEQRGRAWLLRFRRGDHALVFLTLDLARSAALRWARLGGPCLLLVRYPDGSGYVEELA